MPRNFTALLEELLLASRNRGFMKFFSLHMAFFFSFLTFTMLADCANSAECADILLEEKPHSVEQRKTFLYQDLQTASATFHRESGNVDLISIKAFPRPDAHDSERVKMRLVWQRVTSDGRTSEVQWSLGEGTTDYWEQIVDIVPTITDEGFLVLKKIGYSSLGYSLDELQITKLMHAPNPGIRVESWVSSMPFRNVRGVLPLNNSRVAVMASLPEGSGALVRGSNHTVWGNGQPVIFILDWFGQIDHVNFLPDSEHPVSNVIGLPGGYIAYAFGYNSNGGDGQLMLYDASRSLLRASSWGSYIRKHPGYRGAKFIVRSDGSLRVVLVTSKP